MPRNLNLRLESWRKQGQDRMVMGQLDTHGSGLGASLGSALDWWREAGVDCAFVDDPQDWLAAEAKPPAAKAPASPPSSSPARTPPPSAPVSAPIAADRSNWPATLAEFTPWWLAEPSLAPRGLRRLPPTGSARPALMILVPMPAEDDAEALLSGKTGRLLDAMIAAFGLNPAETYLASALPSRVALPDWAALAQAGLGAVLAHHVALVAPQRLLVFGRTDISTLMGHDSAHSALHLRPFNHESGTVPAGFEYDLETLLAKPGWKAGIWQRWLDGGPAGTVAG